MASNAEDTHKFSEIVPGLYKSPENGIPACTICNVPLYPLEQSAESPRLLWTSDAVLMTDERLDLTEDYYDIMTRSYLFKDRPIRCVPAEPLPQTYFRLKEDDEQVGKVVEANDSNGYHHASLYFPVHRACLAIVNRFVKSSCAVPPPFTGSWSLSKIWAVIALRLEANPDENGTMQLMEPNNYFLRGEGHISYQWSDEDALGDPFDVEPYTEKILAHLPHITDDDESHKTLDLEQRLSELPRELYDQVIEEVVPLPETTSQTCSRKRKQEFWREGLKNATLLPFLWDIDKSLIDAAARNGQDLDWELLVRQLAQPDALQAGGAFGNVPTGIWNRRRIWRVLEHMYPGDLRDSEDPSRTLSIDSDEKVDEQGDEAGE